MGRRTTWLCSSAWLGLHSNSNDTSSRVGLREVVMATTAGQEGGGVLGRLWSGKE